jgi:hypothetical protein
VDHLWRHLTMRFCTHLLRKKQTKTYLLNSNMCIWSAILIRYDTKHDTTHFGRYPHRYCFNLINDDVTIITCHNVIKLVTNLVPRASVSRTRTRGETRKPWSGPVNFAFWLANTILSKNNWTWQLTILTIQHLYFYDSCVYEYVLLLFRQICDWLDYE